MTENLAYRTTTKRKTTRPSIKIAAVVLLAVLTFVAAASTFSASLTEVQAVKGEAAQHISSQGAANQSPKGATNSGICGVCE